MGRKSKIVSGAPDGAATGSHEAAPPTQPAGALAAGALLASLAANPMVMATNPILAMTLMNARAADRPKTIRAEPTPVIDPDVQELCDHFHIEDRHTQRLNEIVKNRRDTFEADMLKLWEKLEDAREPAGLLVVKMREMEEGTFVGKQKADPQLASMSKKYGLDNTAESRLADIVSRFDVAKKKAMYDELERHLEVSNKPSAMAMLLLRKLSEGTPLGRPGPPAPGSYVDKKTREQKEQRGEKDKDRRDDRDRDRDRDRRDDRERRRSRSRRR